MKNKTHCLFIALVFLGCIHQSAAQSSRFYRISGPSATTIMAFNPDGILVWNNVQPGAMYTVQTATSLVGETNWVDYVQLPVTNAVNTNLIISFNPPAGMTLIPAGSFTIGNSIGDLDITDAIPANVYVSGFYMEKNLVTYDQWLTVYNYATNHGYAIDTSGYADATNQPVFYIYWFDCVKWCNARSQLEGLTPAYYLDEELSQVYTNSHGYDNIVTIYANWQANGYRLPTEAEWEKAARGGLNGLRFPWGNAISENQANYNALPNPPNVDGFTYDLGPYTGNNTNFLYGTGTSPGGFFAPNNYGLYDMAGNLGEWIWDCYSAPPYPSGSPYLGGTDPRGPDYNFSPIAMQRGGDAFHYASIARCANRDLSLWLSRSIASGCTGFRCVRGLY